MNEAPSTIELYKIAWLVPFVKFIVFVVSTPIDCDIAAGFNKTVPISGRNKPYDPEPAT